MQRVLASTLVLLVACDASDDLHRCGSPPVDCLEGLCVNEQCTAWRLTTSTDFPTAIAVDGDNVDWTTQSGDLFTVPKGGGSGALVAHVTSYATSIATSSHSYYVGSPTDGLIRVDRSSHEPFVLDPGNVQAVATDVIDDVYWATALAFGATQSGAGIKRVRTGMTTLEVLVPDEQSEVIALDYAGVYWMVGIPSTLGWGCALWNDPCEGAQVPVRARFADGTFSSYDAATPGWGSLAADGTALYVADWCAGTVTRIEHADGTATVIASGLEWPGAIVVDDSSVYVDLISRCNAGWSTGSTGGGAIVRIPKNGGPTTFLNTLGASPSAIALDDTSLYFIARDDRPDAGPTHEAIFAIAKPVP